MGIYNYKHRLFDDYEKETVVLNDLVAVVRDLDARGAFVAVSNSEQAAPFFKGFNVESVDVRYCVNRDGANRSGAKEIFIRNYQR